MKEDFEDEMVKNRIISKNGTFKTAFKATLGFYAGQATATLFGLLVIGGALGLAYLAFKSLE